MQGVPARLRACLVGVLAAVAALSAPAVAQNPDDGEAQVPVDYGVTLPETPAGEAMAWVVSAIMAPREADLEGRFANEFLDGLGGDVELVRPTLLRVWGDTRGLRVLHAEEQGGLGVVALTRAVRGGGWWRLRVQVEPDEPHLITVLRTERLIENQMGDVMEWRHLDRLFEGGGVPDLASISAWELRDGGEMALVHGRGGDKPLAIGLTFSLYVLGAVAERVEAGEADWRQLLEIEEPLKSLPPGVLQDVPAGEPRTLEDVAKLMIKMHDNTAADHLINFVGRQAVERYIADRQAQPGLNAPLLTTMDLFRLKLQDDHALANRYAAADEAERRTIVNETLPGVEPDVGLIDELTEPLFIDRIEWFATTDELCRLMVELRAVSMREGQAVIEQALLGAPEAPMNVWRKVWFKGGGELGVWNRTMLLERADGRVFVLSCTFNDPAGPINDQVVHSLANNAVKLLATME